MQGVADSLTLALPPSCARQTSLDLALAISLAPGLDEVEMCV